MLSNSCVISRMRRRRTDRKRLEVIGKLKESEIEFSPWNQSHKFFSNFMKKEIRVLKIHAFIFLKVKLCNRYYCFWK